MDSNRVAVIVWGAKACVRCYAAKKALLKRGYNYTYRDAESAFFPAHKNIGDIDRDAHVQLQIQNGHLPIVRIADKWIDGAELEELIAAELEELIAFGDKAI